MTTSYRANQPVVGLVSASGGRNVRAVLDGGTDSNMAAVRLSLPIPTDYVLAEYSAAPTRSSPLTGAVLLRCVQSDCGAFAFVGSRRTTPALRIATRMVSWLTLSCVATWERERPDS